MTDQNKNQNSESPQKSKYTAVELGTRFRQIREGRSLSIGEVAERLKLPARQIEALETGCYEGLPESVFVRGFLRTYGRFLEMDDHEVDGYLEDIFPAENRNIYAVERNKNGKDVLNYQQTNIRRSFPKWIIAVIILMIIVICIYAWQSKSNAENEKQANSNTPASEVVAPNLMASNISVIPMASDATVNLSTASDASQIKSSEVSNLNNNQAIAPDELVIKVRYRSSLAIKDRNGQFVINKIVPAGSEHHFKGGAPYDVWIGYATGAAANYGGKDISVTDNMLKGKKTSSFKAG